MDSPFPSLPDEDPDCCDETLIASEDLKLSDLPAPDARYDEVCVFCHTFDGYGWALQTGTDLESLARSVETRGYRDCTLDELRATAFIRQRAERWADQGYPPFEQLIKPIYAAMEGGRAYLVDQAAKAD